jgi:isopenicillin N synthase-like dioxygenase
VSRNFPVIDLEAVREPQASIGVRREIAHQVASACEEIGFFAVTGHGVPGAVIADLVAESYAFFDLPLAEKLAVRRRGPSRTAATSRRARSVWPGCAVTKRRRT